MPFTLCDCLCCCPLSNSFATQLEELSLSATRNLTIVRNPASSKNWNSSFASWKRKGQMGTHGPYHLTTIPSSPLVPQ